MSRILILLITVFSLFSAANALEFDKSAKNPKLLQQGEKKESCRVCGMNLKKYYRTSHAVELNDGTKRQYCSISCFAHDHKNIKSNIKKVYAVDAKTAELIDTYNAHYVIGSSVKGTMSKTSKLAFKNRKEAQSFSKRFQGKKIADFNEAFRLAKKEKMMHGKKGMHMPKKTIDVPKEAKCPVCGMFVSKYPSWAAKIETSEGKTYYFDGSKDMFNFYLEQKKSGVAFKEMLVTDYYTQSAIDAKSSFYVTGSDVFGPMGNELVPFKTMDKAKIFQKDHKGLKLLSFDEVTPMIVKSLDE